MNPQSFLGLLEQKLLSRKFRLTEIRRLQVKGGLATFELFNLKGFLASFLPHLVHPRQGKAGCDEDVPKALGRVLQQRILLHVLQPLLVLEGLQGLLEEGRQISKRHTAIAP